MRFALGLLISAFAVAALQANAQTSSAAASYPTRPIKIVVPYPAGGSTDLIGRILGQKISERLGQPVVVENRAGASGAIGAAHVAGSAPDGYTLFLGTSTALAANPHMNKSLPYDPQRDFTPVFLASIWPSIVVVNNSVPVKSMKELNEYLKSRPEQASYASAGNGTPAHLGVELYKKMMGIEMTHVPYKGGAPALTDLMSGQTTLMFAIWPDAMPFVKAGKLKALAVTTAARSPLEPGLPTVAESGVPGYELLGWVAFMAPSGTPREIVLKLNKAFNDALKEKEVGDKLTSLGFEVGGGTPERLGDLIRSESKTWQQLIRDVNIKVE
jgi:tripartite-type tricarboxylate transporter receptor subunit TctC